MNVQDIFCHGKRTPMQWFAYYKSSCENIALKERRTFKAAMAKPHPRFYDIMVKKPKY